MSTSHARHTKCARRGAGHAHRSRGQGEQQAVRVRLKVVKAAPLFTALAEAPDVLSGTVHTKWLEPWLEANSDKLSGQ